MQIKDVQKKKSIVIQQQKQNALSAVMSANEQIANATQQAYQYNVMTPFALNFQRGVNLSNQGLAGRIEGIKMRADAAGDIWNGISSAASSIGMASGTGTGFDLSGLFGSKKAPNPTLGWT